MSESKDVPDNEQKLVEPSQAVPPDGSNPKKVPWSGWIAVVYAIVLYFVAQIVAVLIVSVYPHLRGWSGTTAEHWLTNSVPAQFWYVLFAEGLMFGALAWFIKWRGATLRSIGWRSLKGKDIAYMFIGFLIYFVASAIVLHLASSLVPDLNVDQQQDTGFQNATGALNLWLTFVSLVVLPPLVEESVFRGFVFGGLKNKLPVVWAAIGTSLLFAVAHLQFGSGKPLLWVAALDTFTLSLVLCWLRQKTGGLWAGILVHALKNGLAFFVLFIVPLLHWHVV